MTLRSVSRQVVLSSFLVTAVLIGWMFSLPTRARGQGANAVAVVCAANFAPTVAPDSIAAAFGTGLATRIEAAASVPLPTALAGTTVSLNGVLAPLFFV